VAPGASANFRVVDPPDLWSHWAHEREFHTAAPSNLDYFENRVSRGPVLDPERSMISRWENSGFSSRTMVILTGVAMVVTAVAVVWWMSGRSRTPVPSTGIAAPKARLVAAEVSPRHEIEPGTDWVADRPSDIPPSPPPDPGELPRSDGYHLEADLAGGELQIPDGFHAEFDLGTFIVEDGYHIEHDSAGRVRVIEDGYGLGSDGAIYEVSPGHNLASTADGTVWQVPDGYGIGPDDEIYALAPGFHLEQGPDGQIWEIADGIQLGPDGEEYDRLDGYYLKREPDGSVIQVRGDPADYDLEVLKMPNG